MVVISEEEFEAMQETLHLLQTPANATRLMASVAELDAGKGDDQAFEVATCRYRY